MDNFDSKAGVLDRLKWLVSVRPEGIDRTAMSDAIEEIEDLEDFANTCRKLSKLLFRGPKG